MIGTSAKGQAVLNPGGTIYDIKRIIGRRFDDPVVQAAVKNVPYRIVNKGGEPRIRVMFEGEDAEFSPEEIMAFLLEDLKDLAEKNLETAVDGAVVAVPSYFNDKQRQAVIDAGRIAGLKILKIIDEPTAAALSYSRDKVNSRKQNILVYDLGGATFDASILLIRRGKIEVVCAAGDPHLGGSDVDDLVLKRIMEKIPPETSRDPAAMQALRQTAEDYKQKLSMNLNSAMRVDLCRTPTSYDLYHFFLGRDDFYSLCLPLVRKTIEIVENVLRSAKMTKSDIDEILVVGGATCYKAIRDLLEDFFGKPVIASIDPNYVVAGGAAICGVGLTKQSVEKCGKGLPANEIEGMIRRAKQIKANMKKHDDFDLHVKMFGMNFAFIMKYIKLVEKKLTKDDFDTFMGKLEGLEGKVDSMKSFRNTCEEIDQSLECLSETFQEIKLNVRRREISCGVKSEIDIYLKTIIQILGAHKADLSPSDCEKLILTLLNTVWTVYQYESVPLTCFNKLVKCANDVNDKLKNIAINAGKTMNR